MEIASALLAEPPQIAMSALAIGHTVNAICADSLRPGGIGATSASIVRIGRDRPIPLLTGVPTSTLPAAIQSVIARLITRVPFPLHTVFTNVMARALGPSPH
ncbi:hypothetical protein [Cupriavidus pauculus]|uniref:hypothetical protein n=1 Tax=Cupriavidus pauculus TaxID=82633 RepID=UPI0012489AF0|nr:hypothetical protein [Cupriavidus pauculus]KAB0604317.1 hypothetical protein F7R19_05750 [Cupriavidus pauculus]MCM3606555.1 hypothetical protein [Cupriavidus pauculus]UAL00640.1 hypothetical protein K8O84_04605 [Cupriavidus pauculus]